MNQRITTMEELIALCLDKEMGSDLPGRISNLLKIPKNFPNSAEWYKELLRRLGELGYTLEEIEIGGGLPDGAEYWNNVSSTYKYKLTKL